MGVAIPVNKWITSLSYVIFSPRISFLISPWLGFVTINPGVRFDQLLHFICLGGFSKKARVALNIILMSLVWVIWKERNKHILHHMDKNLSTLCDKIKLMCFWWLKANYSTFAFDYHYRRLDSLECLTTISYLASFLVVHLVSCVFM